MSTRLPNLESKPRTLHFKRLGIVLIVLLLSSFCVYRLHAYQVRRNAKSLLERAHKTRDEGKLDRALEQMRHYLRLEPEDNDARCDFGFLLSQVAKLTGSLRTRKEAFFVLETAVRNDNDRADVRLELVNVAMHPSLGRYNDARLHLKQLLDVQDDDPDRWPVDRKYDADLMQRMAECFEADREYAKAVAYYIAAIRQDSARTDCYLRAARILRNRLQNSRAAEELINDKARGLLARNPKSAAAYVAHAQYTRDVGKLEDAARDVETARELAPTNVSVILASADQALQERFAAADPTVQQRKLDEARTYLLNGIESNPQVPTLFLALGRVDVLANQPKKAAADLKRGLEKLPHDPDLQWLFIDAEVEIGELDDARERIKHLRYRGFADDLLKFEEARIYLRNSKWLKAADLFERVAPTFAKSGLSEELAKRTLLEEADCYLHLGKLDRRLAMFQQWLETDPNWRPARLGLAETKLMLGQIDEALDAYYRIEKESPEVGVTIARLLIIRNLRRRAEDREWREIKTRLTQLAKRQPTSVEVQLLQIEVLAAEDPTDHCEAAQKALEKALEKDPKQLDFLIARATIAERQGSFEEALRRLDEAEKQVGDRIEIRLAKARFFSRRSDAAQHRHIAALASDVDKFRQDEQDTLLRGLGKALVACGEFEAARPVWTELSQRFPYDLEVKLVLFDLARFASDDESAAQTLRELRDMEGKDGSYWRYCEVCTLLRKSLEGESEARTRAWQLLRDLNKLRKNWGRIPAIEGELEDAEHRPELALEFLLDAFNLGERNPISMRRLLRLLVERHRYVEARKIIAGLPEQVALSADMQRLSAEIAFWNQDYTNAYNIACKVIAPNSEDYHDYLWLASLARQVGNKEKTEESLDKARKFGSDKPEVWMLTIDYLVSVERRDDALARLEEGKIKCLERFPVTLAFCCELVGDNATARTTYHNAVQQNPKDPETLMAAAIFLLRHGEKKNAEDMLTEITELKDRPTALSARRLLIQLKALRGNYEDTSSVLAELELLDAELPDHASPDEVASNQRAKSVVLGAQVDVKKRKAAIEILEVMKQNDMLMPEDKFRLARLYESVDPIGNWPKSCALLLQLLDSNQASPASLVSMAHRFLMHNDNVDAEKCVAALEKLESRGPPSLAVTKLRALLLRISGKKDEAINRLKGFEADNKVDPIKFAAAMEDVDPASAEMYYRNFAEHSGKPAGKLIFALYLGRRGQAKDALDLCESCWKDCKPAEVGNCAVNILLLTHADESQSERVGKWLEAEIAKDNANADALRMSLAYLCVSQGKDAQAISVYREIASPNSEALNNLAWLLTFHGGAEEAQGLLEQAQKKSGPSVNLRDTRALANLKLGKYNEAIRELESVVIESPNPSFYCHLAEAYLAADKKVDARNALRKAEDELGLTTDTLPPVERPDYKSLKKKLGDTK